MKPPAALDEEAFAELYRTTSAGLWRYLRRLTGDGDVASDLVQESYVRLLRRPGGAEVRDFKAYLYRIASHLAHDRFRRSRLETGWLERLFTPAAPAVKSGERVDRRLDLDLALAGLPPRQRALLWLAHVEGYEHREIAEILGLKAKSIKVLLHRARRRLLAELDRHGLARPETENAGPETENAGLVLSQEKAS